MEDKSWSLNPRKSPLGKDGKKQNNTLQLTQREPGDSQRRTLPLGCGVNADPVPAWFGRTKEGCGLS